MATLNDSVLNKIIEFKTKDSTINKRISPDYESIHYASREFLNNSMNLDNVPSIRYKSSMISSDYRSTMDSIKDIIKALAENTKDMEAGYYSRRVLNKLSENKIKNSIRKLKKQIDIINNYSCYNIINDFSEQTENSYAGMIGKFTTLPFFIGNAIMYNDYVELGIETSGNISFSNLSFISTIPFVREPSFKISSTDDFIKVTFNISINKIKSNMLYIKFDNDISKADIRLSKEGIEVASGSFIENEMLMNYNQIEIDRISIYLEVPNQNIDKPVSIRVSDIKIFENIKFSKSGVFESRPSKIYNKTEASYVSLSYKNIGNTSYTQTNPSISISPVSYETKYNIVDLDRNLDIRLNKFKYNKEFEYSGLGDLDLLGRQYKKYTIANTDNEWDIDEKKSIILYGLNKDLLSLDQPTREEHAFENWTLSDNYYKTSILNYEDNVTVDTGTSIVIINGKELSGIVKIPIGISEVWIHKKDMDFSSVNMTDKLTTLNPYNFAYLLTGLPEYTSDILSNIDKKVKTFSIDNSTSISLNEPFMPFTEEVTDEYQNIYKLSLTEIPYTPGTYSILPNSGTIYINLIDGSRSITVSYFKASPVKRPCGILFNRLLTFISLQNLLSLKNIDNSIFSLGGTETEKYLILPNLSNITSSQIIYNTPSDELYFSTRIEMLSTNNFLTPIINNISLSVK